MKNQIDFLVHLKNSGEEVRDWPAWKKDIWPEVSNLNDSLKTKVQHGRSKGALLPALEILHHRQK
ncbi:hypothetical protein HSX11_12985 [Oxalobacteraceae bacterium]|nr:hypothetical protein [Oxalobacteraceae bacterium]